MKINIIYPYTNLDFPSKKANMLQTINTCYALAASNKATVHLILRNPKRWNVKDILSYYGLEKCPNLFIHSVAVPYINFPFIKKGLNIFYKFNLYIRVLSLIKNRPDSFMYARDVNILSLVLRFKKHFVMKFVYEAHSIQSWFFRNWHPWDSDKKPFPRWKSRWYARKEKRVLRDVDSIFAVTYGLKNILVKEFRINENKIYVIPDATKLFPSGRKPHRKSDTKKVICYIGQLNPIRGVDLLIKALKYLDNEIELLLVGDSNEGRDLDRLKNLAKKLNLVGRINFTGYIQPSKVAPYLLKSDVVVLPLLEHPHSTYFASSLKQFEYMASKRPIVATDLPSTREILRDRKNAILVQPNNSEALASGIKLVLENKKLAKRIAEDAYREVYEKYTYQKRAEEILSIL